MRARVSVLLVLVCLVTTALIVAQERGVLVITVTDAHGSVMPGALVKISSGTDQRTCTSNERGVCSFAGLASGAYQVQIELTGFATSLQMIALTGGQTLRVSTPLRVGSLSETVIVTGSESVVQTVASPPPPPMSAPVRMGGNVMGVIGAARGTVSELRISDEPYYSRHRTYTESYEDAGENPFRSVSADPLSTFSIDVDTASYANMRRFINSGEQPPAEAIRIEEMINYFHYTYPQPAGEQPFSMTTELAEAPWNSKHRLALIGLQGRELDLRETPPRNLVFLIDVSGSMMQTDKLPLVQSGMRMLAATLRARDRVAIVVYAGNSGLVLPATSGDRKERIDRAIADLQAGGSTNGGAGIRLAYQIARDNLIKGGVNRVILATDGDFNVGVVDQADLVKLIEHERESGVFLSVLGVGTGNLKDSTMEKLADKGNGNYSYLDSIDEAHRVLVKEAGATLVTIAKDVKIQVEFNPKTVNAYRLIGYENRILKNQDFNDDRKDAGEIGAGHSVTAIYEIVPAGVELDRPSVDALKYGSAPPEKTAAPGGKFDGELVTVKLRYKAPDGDVSTLTQTVIADRPQPIGANLGFASAVAEAGMVLRHSPHAGDASLSSAIARARKFRGEDAEGYRAEFIRLMGVASAMPKRDRTSR
ncbi:MAG TPA: von Willebrand factor type A domain-containing protein [Vicinamibacterales bacterium]|nr:von Willebrand factor type A domain-containing protein [Vicinamibacterales bacterium]